MAEQERSRGVMIRGKKGGVMNRSEVGKMMNRDEVEGIIKIGEVIKRGEVGEWLTKEGLIITIKYFVCKCSQNFQTLFFISAPFEK